MHYYPDREAPFDRAAATAIAALESSRTRPTLTSHPHPTHTRSSTTVPPDSDSDLLRSRPCGDGLIEATPHDMGMAMFEPMAAWTIRTPGLRWWPALDHEELPICAAYVLITAARAALTSFVRVSQLSPLWPPAAVRRSSARRTEISRKAVIERSHKHGWTRTQHGCAHVCEPNHSPCARSQRVRWNLESAAQA